MNFRSLIAVVVCLPSLALAAAAPRIPVAVLPPAAPAPGVELSWLIQSKASSALGQSDRYSDFHLKQILGMASEERIDLGALDTATGAAVAARHLGAQRVVYGRLEGKPGAWTLRISAANPTAMKTETRTLKLAAGLAQAVDEGGLAIAALVAKLDKTTLAPKASAVSPATASDEAAAQYGHCQAVLVRQPIGIENPALLREADLAEAISACRAAVTADPAFTSARAALGLALAISGDDKAGIEALGPLKAGEGYEPWYWVARFWLVTRFQSNEAGAAVLREAIAKLPGFLMARGYLGELLNVLGQEPEALAAWSDFLSVAPTSPFVIARVGKTLARLGKHAEALEKTREALKLDKESLELQLQLASRLIDANQLAPAIEALTPLAKPATARPEVLVRLGFAHLQLGQLDLAEPPLRRALAAAKEPGEWRVRGRANYDLALWAVKKNAPDKAQAFLLESMREGFKPRQIDAELKALAAKSEADALKAPKPAGAPLAPKLTLTALPREASPFAVDPSGELDLARPKPPPPQGFEILKFGK